MDVYNAYPPMGDLQPAGDGVKVEMAKEYSDGRNAKMVRIVEGDVTYITLRESRPKLVVNCAKPQEAEKLLEVYYRWFTQNVVKINQSINISINQSINQSIYQ